MVVGQFRLCQTRKRSQNEYPSAVAPAATRIREKISRGSNVISFPGTARSHGSAFGSMNGSTPSFSKAAEFHPGTISRELKARGRLEAECAGRSSHRSPGLQVGLAAEIFAKDERGGCAFARGAGGLFNASRAQVACGEISRHRGFQIGPRDHESIMIRLDDFRQPSGIGLEADEDKRAVGGEFFLFAGLQVADDETWIAVNSARSEQAGPLYLFKRCRRPVR